MAAIINGAKIDEQVYEFGFSYPDSPEPRVSDYETAKVHWAKFGAKMHMRVVYKTEWMDAK